jgi:Transglutaminase-like superfamily
VTVYAYLALIRGRALLKSRGWYALVNGLPPQPVERRPPDPGARPPGSGVQAIAATCAKAARLLPLRTQCLERSYGTCATLRRHGIPASLCVGVSRFPPMRFHAWVETDGQVVNDSPELQDRYRIICVY